MATEREARVKRNANTRFLMVIFGRRHWLSFNDCYTARYWRFISDLGDSAVALNVAGSGAERPLTQQEKDDITSAAVGYSRDK